MKTKILHVYINNLISTLTNKMKQQDFEIQDRDGDNKTVPTYIITNQEKTNFFHFKRWTMKQYKFYMWFAFVISISPIPLYILYLYTRICMKQYIFAVLTAFLIIFMSYRVILITKILLKPQNITIESTTLVYNTFVFGLIIFLLYSFECLIFTNESFKFSNTFQEIFGGDQINYDEQDKWAIWFGRFCREIFFNLPDVLIFRKLIFYLTYNYDYDDDFEFDEDDIATGLSLVHKKNNNDNTNINVMFSSNL